MAGLPIPVPSLRVYASRRNVKYSTDVEEVLSVAEESYQDLYLDMQDQGRLVAEVARLRHANNVLVRKLAMFCRGDFAALPPEILLLIFREALAPRLYLEWSNAPALLPQYEDHCSVDLWMKLSLLSVCTSWNRVGTELLYESVTLRRITHLPVFAQALEERGELGYLVKHLDVSCFVPRGYSTLHFSETKKILDLCPKLSHIRFAPVLWIPQLPCYLPTMTSSVTSLEFSDAIPYSTIFPCLLQLSKQLKCLVLTVPPSYEAHPVLTFPNLTKFYVGLNDESVDTAPRWRIPNLKELWVQNHCKHAFEREQLEVLLRAFGRSITFLRLPLAPITKYGGNAYALHLFLDLLDSCTVLEHLVVLGPCHLLRHRTVKYVDFFTSGDKWAHKLIPVELLKDAFPALRRGRHFNVADGPKWDLVPFCVPHPERAGGPAEPHGETSEPASVEPNAPALAGLAYILQFIDPESVNGDAVCRTDLSADFISDPDDALSVNDSEDSQSDASDDCNGDPFYADDEWEVDRAEALAMFYSSEARDSED
ncbi:hypothetical protein B0H15DRAFT_371127 [Mycena belliarum]|uniref:F-box domain-containing protein n=1 Tax=Mycena belliarum TaxID=1033014 RepID=A0AAD6U3Q2_9AGAR|nr:hypothetical protein B0H15DRAFT_371127 [Mycena belliae]